MKERKGKKKVEREGVEWGGGWREMGREERENTMTVEVTHHSCAPLLLLHCIIHQVGQVLVIFTPSLQFYCSSHHYQSSV